MVVRLYGSLVVGAIKRDIGHQPPNYPTTKPPQSNPLFHSFNITLFLLLSPSMLLAQEINLSTHHWESRIIVIASTQADDPNLLAQLALFRTETDAMKERKLIVYQILPNGHRTGWQTNKAWRPSNGLKDYHLSKKRDFEILLIGLDGGVKLRSNELLKTQTLFATIDSMPMRRQELREKQQRKN